MLTMLFFHKKRPYALLHVFSYMLKKTMLLHDSNWVVGRLFSHAVYMETMQNEKGLVIMGLFFSVTVVLVMIYMVIYNDLIFNYAVITMRLIVSTIAFYHAIFPFSCKVCSLFWRFFPMLSVVNSFFSIFGSFFLHGAYYAFAWGCFFYKQCSSC